MSIGWIYRPPPLPDELLSSWLARIAYKHRDSLISFCKHEWSSNHFHYHDIDVLAPQKLLKTLSSKTAATEDQVLGTCLKIWKGTLYSTAMLGGKARYIMAAGAGNHKCRSAGMQWCPECLASDTIPYWRKTWRLSFVTCCIKHSVILADRCQHCGHGARPRKRADTRCWNCWTDLRGHPSQVAYNEVVQFQDSLEQYLLIPRNDGLKSLFGEENHYEDFRALWICFRLLSVSRISNRLCEYIDSANHWEMSPRSDNSIVNWRTEALGVNGRHEAIRRLSFFQDNWPINFLKTCAAINMNWSEFSRGSEFSGIPEGLKSIVEANFRHYG